jgi:hypothetical protein
VQFQVIHPTPRQELYSMNVPSTPPWWGGWHIHRMKLLGSCLLMFQG